MNAVVNLSHRFDLPPDALFALLLDPTAWWDEDATGTLDATVGGAFTSAITSAIFVCVPRLAFLTLRRGSSTTACDWLPDSRALCVSSPWLRYHRSWARPSLFRQ